jgi:hypothetical protein
MLNWQVLVHERDGHSRGILADFDLCKTQKGRQQEASMSAKSVSVMPGPRGTPGVLTMAPEVLEQGATPDEKADMFCFGDLPLLCFGREKRLQDDAEG